MTAAPGEAGGPAEGRTEPAVAPRPANQGRTEPIPPSPADSEAGPSGDASTGSPPGDAGEGGPGDPYPPFAEPVLDAADGRPAVAVPGKPDGEVDTRV